MHRNQKQTGICFVLSSPSAAGKTSVAKLLLERDPQLQKTISHTTRKPRPGEHHGIDYYFVQESEFEDLKDQGQFLEWAQVYDRKYATSEKEVQSILDQGKDVLLVIESQGAQAIKQKFPEHALILLLPPSVKTLEERIRNRPGSEPEDVARRMDQAKQEIQKMAGYDYVVVNKDIEEAAEQLANILYAERQKLSRNQKLVQELCSS